VVNLLTAVTIEKNDTHNREKNILIMGVPNADPPKCVEDKIAYDNVMVKSILGAIGVEAVIESTYRFNTRADSKFPGIIKITLSNKEKRNEILKASMKLRTAAD